MEILIAVRLITDIFFAGADVKFQRTIEIVYSKEELLKPRENHLEIQVEI